MDPATAPFTFDFSAKSLPATTESGDLIIRGIASDYSLDRVGDIVEPGALEGALADYLNRSGVFCWEHDRQLPIGRVLSAKVTHKGLEIVARVDRPVPGDTKRAAIFELIRRQSVKGLSIAGIFRRMGQKIRSMDLLEISAVSVPANRNTTFEVIAVKAFDQQPRDAFDASVRKAERAVDLALLELEVMRLAA